VRAQAVERDTAIMGGNLESGRVRDDGNFELKPIFGASRLTVGPLPDGWAVRSIEYNGRDFTSLPLDTQGQTIEGVTITLTDRFPSVAGTLRDAKGNPATSGTFILFPQDASAWIEDLRAVQVARPDQAGLFSIKAVRPGEYLAVAVPTVMNNQWNDPEYLEGLRDRAIHLTLSEREHQTIDVTVR
jgi:hypothetical protein